jgi:hypothetical protein
MRLEDLLAKNRALHHRHAGERCFIVANGPSLAGQDLARLEGEHLIVVSWFHRHELARRLAPAYWVIADPGAWTRDDQPFLPALQRVHELGIPTKLLLPSGGFARFSAINTAPFIDVHYLHFDTQARLDAPVDLSRPVPPMAQNVVVVALLLALHLGCSPIYLVGCDHDFLGTSREDFQAKRERHFYPEQSPASYAGEFTWEQFSAAMDRLRTEYRALADHAGRFGFSVQNATRGGCLEAFPRVEYESLFAPGAAPAQAPAPAAEPLPLAGAAIERLNAGDAATALVLADAALTRNVGRTDRVEGVEYVKALCLARLGRLDDALVLARLDAHLNPGNRASAERLVGELEQARAGGR